MRRLIFIFFTLMFSVSSFSQSKQQLNILDAFVIANNLNTETAFTSFIKSTYSPTLLKRVNIDEHVKFYRSIADEFNQLNPLIYKVIENEENRLVVHLIKRQENIKNKYIPENEILVLEMDLDKSNSKYLDKALGLGSLLCEIKKGRN